jgi:signal transduction histidine kinase/AraC-like DNA-binding protein/ABC-type sugar transport system substrate-binding protein
MAAPYRVGIQIIPSDPFWVQIRMAIEQQALKTGVDLISFDIDNLKLPEEAYPGVVEELLADQIDALIILDLPEPLIKIILGQNIPVISLVEQLGSFTQVGGQARLVSPLGLYEIARLMSQYLIEKLQGRGSVLVVGGLTLAKNGIEGVGEDGRSLLTGISDTFAVHNLIRVSHIPTSWSYEWAYPQILTGMGQLKAPPEAIFSLSDTLALAARAAAGELGLLTPRTLLVGINGDPQALAAIAEGTMAATVGISAVDFATQAVNLALQAAAGQTLPAHFSYQPRLITAENVAEVAVQKLIAIAELPNLLVGVNRRREQQHLVQLETSLAINRRIGAILDQQELSQTIVDLIRSNYNYDRVQLYYWSEADRTLRLDEFNLPDTPPVKIRLEEGGVFSAVLKSGELIFVPDMRHSQRFAPDPRQPDLRSRVVLPVRFSEKVLGVLDLQCDHITPHTREQLLGLQLLADQVAIAIRNAQLYSEALAARQAAEKADKLKTLLLANVSHEFRTPLNIILGYTEGLLKTPNSYHTELPAELISDLGRIYRSGEHLLRLINDLLDLSRAEIDELEIFPEIIDIRPILEEVFQSVAELVTKQKSISWHFEALSDLPYLQIDPVRLRQILLNLLSNSRKFTDQGRITLGAEVQPPYVHLWVKDTGRGISPDQQALIFDSFMVGENSNRRSGGVGLGLSITRHLVTLHRGTITVESEPGKGSTFHIYLPLPNLTGQLLALPPTTNRQTLVYISNCPDLPPEIERLSHQTNLQLCLLRPAEVRACLLDLHPSILAWDTAGATQSDWLALDYLRETQQLAQLPLMLYGKNAGGGQPPGLTNILLKPFSGQSLAALLEALGPKQNRGEVLIVDDDPETLDFYQQLIRSALPGFTTYRAENGRSAIAILKQHVPGLVIIDLVMPEVDGYAVVEWLRSNPPTQNVPVLVISGKALSADYIQRLDYPRVVFQTKNILYDDEVTNTLRQVSAGTTLLPQFNSIRVKRTVAYLQDNYTRPISLNEIAQEVGISKNYLSEIFHQELGISPWEFLTRYRINQARQLLKTTNLNITEVAAQIGFDDPAHFSRIFRAHLGQSPKEYRNSTESVTPGNLG